MEPSVSDIKTVFRPDAVPQPNAYGYGNSKLNFAL